MQKTITTESGKRVELSSSAAFLYIYKNQFGEDPLKQLMSLSGEETIELSTLYNYAWALAKCARPSDTPDPMTFYLENDDFYPVDYAQEIIEMLTRAFMTDTSALEEEALKNGKTPAKKI